MSLEEFLEVLSNHPEHIKFSDTIATIDKNYAFTPAAFRNGELLNETGQNSGSCKIFSFARLHNLTQAQTLNCFGDYYRVDVLHHPDGVDHQNIRNFIRYGWDGIEFYSDALKPL